MRVFDAEILPHLNSQCNKDPISFIGLGMFDFQLAFGNIDRIQAFEKVAFCISEKTYTWQEGPADVPIWLLIGQIPVSFELISPFVLRMVLASGDYLDFHTNEGSYEAVVINFGKTDDKVVMAIY